jgi:nucleotide-binding universal stress UspA family protein
MKTILVPTDFSLQSENALRAAASIAKEINAEILVVHMVGIKDTFLTREEASSALESVFYIQLTEKRFSEFLDRTFLEGINVRTVIKRHLSFSEINEVATENEVNLIVMSSHGTSGFQEELIGSNTEKVVRTATIPVLVIKQPISDFKLDNGTFACDFTSENIEPFKKARQFFTDFDANMNLIYVNTSDRDFKTSREIEELLFNFFTVLGDANPQDRIKDVNIICDHSAEEGIFSFSSMNDADIIAIPTHGRQGIAQLFKGSITEDIANHSVLPVLTIRI